MSHIVQKDFFDLNFDQVVNDNIPNLKVIKIKSHSRLNFTFNTGLYDKIDMGDTDKNVTYL